jgi:uncharacterized membrane protein (GlpM family)
VWIPLDVYLFIGYRSLHYIVLESPDFDDLHMMKLVSEIGMVAIINHAIHLSNLLYFILVMFWSTCIMAF